MPLWDNGFQPLSIYMIGHSLPIAVNVLLYHRLASLLAIGTMTFAVAVVVLIADALNPC